ncbi:MAG: orotidine-5'-phosphate decarboxylase [Campylobacterales bacterium]
MELVVALDLPSKDENIKLLEQLKGLDIWVKVGLRSFIRDGSSFCEEIKSQYGFKIFLDLKLYDIPNTMSQSVEEVCKLGVDMLTLHASSGKVALKECVKRASAFEKRPLLVAVTALTSFSDDEFREIYGDSIEQKADFFAKECEEAQLDGVVCSVYESLDIKQSTNLLTITPGIRLEKTDDDQKRPATVADAKSSKSDFIVVGRPIYRAKDPLKVVQQIKEEV